MQLARLLPLPSCLALRPGCRTRLHRLSFRSRTAANLRHRLGHVFGDLRALAPAAPPTTAPTAAPSGPTIERAAAPTAAPPTIPNAEAPDCFDFAITAPFESVICVRPKWFHARRVDAWFSPISGPVGEISKSSAKACRSRGDGDRQTATV